MREIKFRGIYTSKGIKNMVYGNFIKKLVDGKVFYEIENSDFDNFSNWTVDPETIGQLTGLKDKNGLDIYEGDIVKANLRHKNIEIIGRVQMPKSCWIITFLNEAVGYYNSRRTAEFNELEVIGNIYENPELLK